MMGVSREDALQLSLWEYEARLWHWNEAHKMGDEVEAPDADRAMKVLDLINSDPRLTN